MSEQATECSHQTLIEEVPHDGAISRLPAIMKCADCDAVFVVDQRGRHQR